MSLRMCDARSSASTSSTVKKGYRTTPNNLYNVYQRKGNHSSFFVIAFMSTVLPSYNAVSNDAIDIFETCTQGRTAQCPPTHCVLTGGKTYQIYAEKLDQLYSALGTYFTNGGNEMPSVSECRTVIFPMYYDLDMKLPIDTLGKDAIQSIARVVVKQTLRFYPEDMHERLGRCIVTDKWCIVTDTAGCAEMNVETGLYKHGVHLHFPYIMVDVDSARQIRMGVLNGLISYLGSWEELLGIDPGDKWDDFVDDAVYNTGLRMLFSPKATKCKLCIPGSGSCKKPGCCGQNKRYIIDTRVYRLCMALGADGEVDAEYERSLKGNRCNLITKCSVRAPDGTELTQGYAIYPGCPQLTTTQLTAAATGKKRKVSISSLDGSAKHPMDRRFKDEITDAKARSIARKYLLKFSPKYATCTIKLSRCGNTVRVNLRGDDAKYCINKMGHHNSSNVYMDFYRNGVNADAFMKCYCPSKTTVGRDKGVECGKLRNRKAIDSAEVDVLFANTVVADNPIAQTDRIMFGGGTASAAAARKTADVMTDGELLRAGGVDIFS